MKSLLPLAIVLSVTSCQGAGSGTNCKLASAAYVGQIDLTRGYGPMEGLEGGPYLGAGFGATAVYSPSADAEPLSSPNYLGFARVSPSFLADCKSIAGSDQCCYVASLPDAGNGFPDNLSAWNVTVTDERDPDGGDISEEGTNCAPPSMASPPSLECDGGSLTWQDWSGGDELLIQGNDAATGAFSAEVTAPVDVDGLNSDLFSPDGGIVPLGRDLTLTWTPGGASSVTINAEDGQTFGTLICTAPDNGSFTIPSSALSKFQSGDQGGLAVFRSVGSCAYSKNASISILVQTETWARVLFQ